MASVEVGDLTIAFRREGDGPAVLLVHGFVGDGATTWRDQIIGLSDAYTVVAWDAPGLGGSSAVPEWWRMPQFADCLAEFASTLGVERAHVVGLSFGGALALELFRRHRGLVGSLVLADAYAGWAGSLAPATVRERLELSLRASELPPDEFVATMLPSMFSPEVAPERAASFAASVAGFDPSGFRTLARASAEADLRDVLPLVDVPTLLLYGDRDVRAPREVALHLEAEIRGSRLVMLPGVGHVSSVEDPVGFNREVRAFLDQLVF
jgi:pimeloyl-ACP methyl ester carboxylesterase